MKPTPALRTFVAAVILAVSASFGQASLQQSFWGSNLTPPDTLQAATCVNVFSKWVYVHSYDYRAVFKFTRNALSGFLSYDAKYPAPPGNTSGTLWGNFVFKELPGGNGMAYFNLTAVGHTPVQKLYTYSVDSATGAWTPMDSLSLPGQGTTLLSSDKRFLYIVGPKIIVYALDSLTGTPLLIADTANGTGEAAAGNNKSAFITPDGTQLYSSGFAGTIATIGVHPRDPVTGLVSSAAYTKPVALVSGALFLSMPRDGRHVYASDSKAGNFYIYTRNAADGSLTLRSSSLPSSYMSSGCLVFAPNNLGAFCAGSTDIGWCVRDTATGLIGAVTSYVTHANYGFIDIVLDAPKRAMYTVTWNHSPVQTRLHTFRTVNYAIGVESAQILVPQALTIDATPNPFSRATRLTCGIGSSAASGALKIFSLDGRLISLFQTDNGNNTVDWDASDCPSGTYVLNFTVRGKNAVSKKITLMR